jgi:hypothetical protein
MSRTRIYAIIIATVKRPVRLQKSRSCQGLTVVVGDEDYLERL